VLTGAYRGDFDVALERAAAFFRVIAVGRRELALAGEPAGTTADGAEADLDRADRNERCADALHRAAAAWRAGTLL
jgi:hypothetical protein